MSLSINPTQQWNGLFWAYNLPLQMWRSDEGWRVLNNMPRKEGLIQLEDLVTEEELPQFCQNAATILRNLADLFELLGKGEINHIYYPDELPEDAIKSARHEVEE